MTRALLACGAEVIVNGRDARRLEAFAGRVAASQADKIRCAPFDVADIEKARAFFAALPRLDILVNNAVAMTPRPMRALEAEDFEMTYRSAVTAVFEAVRAARPALRAAIRSSGDASIVNVASMYGLVAPDQRIYSSSGAASPFHYGPAKAAQLQLTRHLAAELGPERIRVNALVPGPFPRPEIKTDDPAFAERLARRTMLGRLGTADEIAGPLVFLASPASSYMTGASLVVDGGWTAW